MVSKLTLLFTAQLAPYLVLLLQHIPILWSAVAKPTVRLALVLFLSLAQGIFGSRRVAS